MGKITKIKIIITVGLVAFAFNACIFDGFRSISTNNLLDNPSENLSLTGIQAFEKSVYPLSRGKCVTCHEMAQSPFHASSDLNTAYLAAKSRVAWTNIPASKLIIKTTDGHCGAACTTDGMEMSRAVNFWKFYEKSETPVVIGGSASDSVLRSASRKFVSTKLNDIFGGSAGAVTSSLIANDAGRFGGPCDLYATDFNGSQNYGNCNLHADSQASLIGPQTPSRQSLVVRACQRIVQDNAAVSAAVTNAVGSNATGRAPASGDIQSMYELFYTGRVATDATLAALAMVGTGAQQKGYGTMGAWRYILLTLCQSPDWQVP